MSYRLIHKIDSDAFKTDSLKSDLIRDPQGQLSDLCKQYYHVLKALLNKHATITTNFKSVSHIPPAPWMILQPKRRRRYFERVWRKSRSHLGGQVIQNSSTNASHKWLKSNRIIIQMWSQITVKIHVSYGIA